MKRLPTLLLLALPLLATPVIAAELSGAIYSPSGKLPASITVLAEPDDKSPAIAGTVEKGRYRITVPDNGSYLLQVRSAGWQAAPTRIAGPITAPALDVLLYPADVPQPALAQELIRMGEADQAVRANIPYGDQEYWKRMRAEDKLREERLGRIIDEHGWPRISQVGHEAANGAWMVAQHGTYAFLKRCLPLMQAAFEAHEITAPNLALTIDRVLMNDEKEQRYGSQFKREKDGKLIPFPMEDAAHVDERRASMGLEPFETNRKRLEN